MSQASIEIKFHLEKNKYMINSVYPQLGSNFKSLQNQFNNVLDM